MRVVLSRWIGFVLLLAALPLVSSQFSVEAGPAESRLSPANPLFDVEALALKFVWRAELGSIGGDRLEALYPLGPYLLAETPDGEVHVLEAKTGSWQTMTRLRHGLSCGPALSGNTILLISNSRIYAFDTETDQLSDATVTGFGQFADPLVFEDTVILGGADGDIRSLTIEGRDEVWTAAVRGTIWEQPVVAGGNLYVAGSEALCLTPDTGLELWRWKPGKPSRLTAGVAAHGGTVFVGDDRGLVYGLDAEAGQPTWQTHMDSPVNALRIVQDRLLVFTGTPALVCLAASGERQRLWSYAGAERLVGTADGTLYLQCTDGSLAAVSLAEGEELWREPMPEGCLTAVHPAQPVLYVGNQEGTVAAFQKLD